MSNDLQIDYFKSYHQSLDPFQHEFVIIINVVYLSLLGNYLTYKFFAWTFHRFLKHPKLPTVMGTEVPITKHYTSASWWINGLLQALFLLSAFMGVLGVSNCQMLLVMGEIVINIPAIAYDIYLMSSGHFYQIKVNDFLLFHTLFSSVLRLFRLFATLNNLIFVLSFASYLPEGLTFVDFM